jgi:hypothetical protein
MVERAADMVTAMVPKVQKKFAAAFQQQQFLQQHSGQSTSATGGGTGSSSSGSSGGSNEGITFSRDQVRTLLPSYTKHPHSLIHSLSIRDRLR